MIGREQRRTVGEWVHHLEAPDAQLTLDEFNALTLLHIRENVLRGRLAAEHTEGMVGAIDQLAAGLAERSGLPYASSDTVREALDARRDERRRLAAAQREDDRA